MSSSSKQPPPGDPRPQPPRKPDSDECCHSGCTFCVLEMYQEDLEQYQQDLTAWQARQDAAATLPLPAPKKLRARRQS